MIAFILGNGRSRYKFDHTKLFEYGTVFACNAAYRDVKPHYLVSVDMPMINEIINNLDYDAKFYIPANVYEQMRIKDERVKHFDTECEGITDSGNFAAMLACSLGYTNVYMIGFDYISMNYFQNNIYTGTENYRRKNHRHTLPISIDNWYLKANTMIRRHPYVTFIRVNGNDYEPPIDYHNFFNISLEDFDIRFKDVVDFDIVVPEGYHSEEEIKLLEKRIKRLERTTDARKKHMARLQKIKERPTRHIWTRRK